MVRPTMMSRAVGHFCFSFFLFFNDMHKEFTEVPSFIMLSMVSSSSSSCRGSRDTGLFGSAKVDINSRRGRTCTCTSPVCLIDDIDGGLCHSRRSDRRSTSCPPRSDFLRGGNAIRRWGEKVVRRKVAAVAVKVPVQGTLIDLPADDWVPMRKAEKLKNFLPFAK